MKIKVRNKATIRPSEEQVSFEVLKFQKDISQWGLSASLAGQKLFFSGPKSRLEKILGWFSKKTPSRNLFAVDAYTLFSPGAKIVWDTANKSAKNRGSEISAEDLFLALLKDASIQQLLHRLRIHTHDTKKFLKNYLTLKPPGEIETIKKIPFQAFALAVKLHNHKVGSLMLLGALVQSVPQNNILQAIFSNIGVDLEKLEVFAVWIYDLQYDFPKNSEAEKILYCCRQSQTLEQHFGYFFEYPAIEAAVSLSKRQTLKDLEHKKSLQILVKACNLAKNKNLKNITKSLVEKVYTY